MNVKNFKDFFYCNRFVQAYGSMGSYHVDSKLVVVPCGTHLPLFQITDDNRIVEFEDVVWLHTSKSGRTRHGLMLYRTAFSDTWDRLIITRDYGIIKIRSTESGLTVFWNSKTDCSYGITTLVPIPNVDPDMYAYVDVADRNYSEHRKLKLVIPERMYSLHGVVFDENMSCLYKVMERGDFYVCCGFAMRKSDLE